MQYLAKKDANSCSANGIEKKNNKQGRIDSIQDIAERNQVNSSIEKSQREGKGSGSEGTKIIHYALVRIINNGLRLDFVKGPIAEIALHEMACHPTPP